MLELAGLAGLEIDAGPRSPALPAASPAGASRRAPLATASRSASATPPPSESAAHAGRRVGVSRTQARSRDRPLARRRERHGRQQMLEVDSGRRADLFWAIRGDSDNFSVVTRFDYRLQPVNVVTGGMLALPATQDTLAGLVAEAEATSDDCL